MNQHTLFTQVSDYYSDLVTHLAGARQTISMTYLAFDHGVWAERIGQVLTAKAAAGVTVRLLVDEIGQLLDEPRHILQNRGLLNHLRAGGVQVDVYRPAAPLHLHNRLHCKIGAIDDRTVFLGGSNIGDYYTTWTDTNLRVDGRLGQTFHNLYVFLCRFSRPADAAPAINPSDLRAGDDRLWLTIPSHHLDIRSALLKLIHDADRSLYIRTWYFLPDSEILNALCERARNGVQVNVLLSHKTRVRPVDFANHLHIHQLASAGGHVHRYMPRYMHAKAAWNSRGDVLFGSANLDSHSMRGNFESCLQIHDHVLAAELRRAYEADVRQSIRQSADDFRRRSLAGKALTHACNLAAPWL